MLKSRIKIDPKQQQSGSSLPRISKFYNDHEAPSFTHRSLSTELTAPSYLSNSRNQCPIQSKRKVAPEAL